MKQMLIAVALLASAPAFADPIVGTWQTAPGDDGNFAHVNFTTCGSEICATFGQAFSATGSAVESEHVGKQMVWDMEPKGDGRYAGGKIWAPDRDKTYRSKMTLAGNTLSVSGCIGPICRSQDWTRVK